MTTPMFRAEDFVGHQGEVFLVGEPAAVELTLTSVTTWGPPAPERARQPFSVVLHGPLLPVLAETIQLFRHPAMGEFEIFIVPNGPEEGRMRYQADFA